MVENMKGGRGGKEREGRERVGRERKGKKGNERGKTVGKREGELNLDICPGGGRLPSYATE